MLFARKILFFCLTLVLLSCNSQTQTAGAEKVVIAYAEPISSFSPLNYESKNRKYLSNIYETLVRYDKTFNYDTSLATSWGRLDDLSWDFRLRQGVFFHDGTNFDADDVIYSINLAMENPDSQLVSLLSNIVGVEKIDDYKIQIKTKTPDPLLLNKLVNVYIFPAGYIDFKAPVGTGSYMFFGFDKANLNLKRFDSYWGSAPYFAEAVLESIVDPEERFSAIISGKVQVLANIPPQFVGNLSSENIKVSAFPSLEVSYLLFNFDKVFSDKNLRQAVYYALANAYADKFGAGYLLPTDQFAALGIFGYSRSVLKREQNLEKAKELRATHAGEVSLTFDVPQGLEKLAEQIKADLSAIDINVTINSLPPSDFQDKILAGQSDFYFFGWKYDLADVSDFFESVIHSKVSDFGTFNGMNYKNDLVDKSIEEASEILDTIKRRSIIEEITAQILEDRIGVPLFEAELLYGVRPEIIWDVRLDGLILASEITGNGV